MPTFIKKIFTRKPKIIVIVGPTSSGKTSLSIDMARYIKGEIVSADSRQVYTQLNLLSGKVTADEMKNVPHHMLDVVDISSDYSVSQYVQEAKKCIADIIKRGKTPIICGGTGFYIDALVYDIQLPEVPPNTSLREHLRQKTTSELNILLAEKDPARAAIIDHHNRHRLIRSLEVADALGVNPPPPTYDNPPYRPLIIGLTLDLDVLKERISKRMDERISAGMIDEARNIFKKHGDTKLQTLGLDARYACAVAKGEMDIDTMKNELLGANMHYAKRQMTWWKRNKDIHWFNPLEDKAEMLKTAKHFI